jgi:hypothetical protein
MGIEPTGQAGGTWAEIPPQFLVVIDGFIRDGVAVCFFVFLEFLVGRE